MEDRSSFDISGLIFQTTKRKTPTVRDRFADFNALDECTHHTLTNLEFRVQAKFPSGRDEIEQNLAGGLYFNDRDAVLVRSLDTQ